MRRILVLALTAAALVAVPSAGAVQPAAPGCFGQDRAYYIHLFQESTTMPGASEWGAMAAERASANGDMNRAYRDSSACGSVS